jgi:hypothetical protein
MTIQEQMVELLQAEIARLNALARERGRLMQAKEIIGRLEGQVALLQSHDAAIASVPVLPPAPTRQLWWRWWRAG